MAEYRKVATKLWTDPWVFSLSAEEKLLWLWLITNPHANVAGIYQVAAPFIAFETGTDMDFVARTMEKFQRAGKVMWDPEQGVVWVKRMREYQESASPKVQVAIQREIEAIPDGPVKQAYLAHYQRGEGVEEIAEHAEKAEGPAEDATEDRVSEGDDRVSIPYGYSIDRVSIPYPESATETETETETETDTLSAAAAGAAAANAPPGKMPSVFSVWEQNMGPLTPLVAEGLEALAREHGPDWVARAIREAVVSGGKTLRYVQAILDRWKREGYGTRPKRRRGRRRPRDEPEAVVDEATRAEEDAALRALLADEEQVEARDGP